MQMRIDSFDQLEIEFAQQLAIAIDSVEHRIEDHRLAARAACQEIAVGAGYAVEQLTKDHGHEIREPIPNHITGAQCGRIHPRYKMPGLPVTPRSATLLAGGSSGLP